MGWNDTRNFSDLVGRTLTAIEGAEPDSELVTFTCADGTRFRQFHNQDCCESVTVCDVVGDVADLIGSPILQAEEVTSEDRPSDLPAPGYKPDSQTWTFYKLATVKGYVTIRWFGESNGWYSESVDLEIVPVMGE